MLRGDGILYGLVDAMQRGLGSAGVPEEVHSYYAHQFRASLRRGIEGQDPIECAVTELIWNLTLARDLAALGRGDE